MRFYRSVILIGIVFSTSSALALDETWPKLNEIRWFGLGSTKQIQAKFKNGIAEVVFPHNFVGSLEFAVSHPNRDLLAINDIIVSTQGVSDFHLVQTPKGILLLNENMLDQTLVRNVNDQTLLLFPNGVFFGNFEVSLDLNTPGNVVSFESTETGLDFSFKVIQIAVKNYSEVPEDKDLDKYILMVVTSKGDVLPIAMTSAPLQRSVELDSVSDTAYLATERRIKGEMFRILNRGRFAELEFFETDLDSTVIGFDDGRPYIRNLEEDFDIWKFIAGRFDHAFTEQNIVSSANLSDFDDFLEADPSDCLNDALVGLRRADSHLGEQYLKPYFEIPWYGDVTRDQVRELSALHRELFFLSDLRKLNPKDASKILENEMNRLSDPSVNLGETGFVVVLLPNSQTARVYFQDFDVPISKQVLDGALKSGCEQILSVMPQIQN